MQLILDTEDCVNINEKMSAINQETLNEKPLPNGDNKEIVEEVNGKIETNGTSDKENVQNNENILTNSETIESKDAGDIVSAEKPIEECTTMKECPPMKESTPTEESSPIEGSTSPVVMENDKENTESINLDKPGLGAKEKDVLIDEKETQDLNDEIKLQLAETEKPLLDIKENPELDDKENPELDDKKTPKLGDIKSLESNERKNQELDDEEILESEDKEKQEIDKTDTSELDDREKDQLLEIAKLESDSKETTELDGTENSKIDVPEEQLAISSIKAISTETNSPLDEELKVISAETSSTLNEELKESQSNITQKNKNVSEKKNIVMSTVEKVQAMEIDGNDSYTIGQEDEEDSSEKGVTQSISDMVDNIVQNLNDDTADDLMDNIEHEMIQTIDEKSKKILDKNEMEKDNIIQEDETKQNETSSYPVISKTRLEDDENKMEVDQEADINSESKISSHAPGALAGPESEELNQSESTLHTDQAPSTAAVDEDKESTKNAGKTDGACSESINLVSSQNNDIAQININSVIEQETSVKENNAVELSEITQDTVSTVKEIEKDQVNSIDTVCPKVIDIKSGDSSIHNLEDGSSINKIEDDIITLASSNIEKVLDTATKDDASDISEKQNSVLKAGGSDGKDDNSDVEEVSLIEKIKNISEQKIENEKTPEKNAEKSSTPLIKLSNTMNILSDDEEDPPSIVPSTNDVHNKVTESSEKECINLDDDDDIMLIDEDTKEDKKESPQADLAVKKDDESNSKINSETNAVDPKDADIKAPEIVAETEKDSTKSDTEIKQDLSLQPDVKIPLETVLEKPEKSKSLIPGDFFKTYRKNLTDMTRDDLEEFCILKIVESIIDRSNINEIRSKLKVMGQTIEEYKKKAMMLTKQNRDLQVVLKSVQEEQKKSTGNQPITPLKITRSVGMQVLMTDKNRRRVMPPAGPASTTNMGNNVNQVNNRNVRNMSQSPRNIPQKSVNIPPIPVPRLVPAGLNVASKTVSVTTANNSTKASTVQNGVKNVSPAPKPEKRTHSRMQSQSSSVTVDLTDDEPPSKVATKTSPAPPVRLVNQQNLLAPRQQFSQQVNSPRKVYIPISLNGPQAQAVRPGQTIMLKTVSAPGQRTRGPAPTMVRAQQNVQIRRVGARHPAPLPDAMKQYQPPNWKALPPAPDLKLSKVENGIVISWKIEGYQEDSYEEIASYQLYAYQETSAPPNTALWKKIGDVKALPLPMACTLTQFMAGYKYYFAVRAVDVRSRLGPFSLPGSILLLNKM